MDYSVFLGPDRKHIADNKWDEYRDAGKMTLFSLVFRRHGDDGWYKVTLDNGKEVINVGQVFKEARVGTSWGAIPNPSHCDKTIIDGIQVAVKEISQRGFATRLDAGTYLMRKQGFTNPKEW